MADELNDQRVEVRWKVTQGDDWFRPFRVLDDNGDDVTASCAVIVQARVKQIVGRIGGRPLEVSGPIVGGRWAGYHEIRADREDTRDVVEQVGDWEMEIIPPDDMDGTHDRGRAAAGRSADRCPCRWGSI